VVLLEQLPAMPAGAACSFAVAGGGPTLMVAVSGQAGRVLEVDWGDATRSTLVVGQTREESFLVHAYPADGTYRVRASVDGGDGCAMRGEFDIPYADDSSDQTSAEVLPPIGPPIPTPGPVVLDAR